MERIEPDSVAAFFAAHPDVKPLQLRFVRHHGPGRVVDCCGSVAVALMRAEDEGDGRHGFSTTELDYTKKSDACRIIAGTLGLPVRYVLGFVDGWDGVTWLNEAGDYTRGYEDGHAAQVKTLIATKPADDPQVAYARTCLAMDAGR
jgi:hypothetical protein